MIYSLNFFKDKSERALVTLHDLFNVFLLMVAFKADDASSFSWNLIFFIPWIWFAVIGMLATVVRATSLTFSFRMHCFICC